MTWQVKPLGDVCEVLDSKRKPITKRDRVAGEYPYYGATGILDYVADYIFDQDLVLLGEDGAKWGAGENSAFGASGKYWVNNHAHALQPLVETINSQWLIYYLNFSDLSQFVSGLTVPKLNQGSMREIPIPVPALPEQRRIVAILDEAFAGIATARANAEQSRKNAREVFERRLESVFAQAFARDEVVALADLATDITDGDHLPPPKAEQGIPFITIGNIVKDTRTIDFEHTFKVPQSYFDKLKPNRKPRQGDVLYTVTGSFGIPVLVAGERSFCFQRHIGLIRPKAGIDSQWLQHLLMSPQLYQQAEQGATGAAQKTVALKTLRAFKVPRTPLPRQKADSESLCSLTSQTQHLESLYTRKLAALDELKQSLLQQAFSGAL